MGRACICLFVITNPYIQIPAAVALLGCKVFSWIVNRNGGHKGERKTTDHLCYLTFFICISLFTSFLGIYFLESHYIYYYYYYFRDSLFNTYSQQMWYFVFLGITLLLPYKCHYYYLECKAILPYCMNTGFCIYHEYPI